MTTETKDTKPTIPLTEMTLRDHFAACALTGMLADPDIGYREDSLLAKGCYGIADAMIAERAKGGAK